MSRTTKIILATFVSVGIFTIICVAIGFLGAGSISSLLMGNKSISLNCDQLPDVKQVETVIKQHSDLIEQIKAIRPGSILVEASETEACPEKGFLLIIFGGYDDSVKIKALIGRDTFFGIPYQMENQ